MEWSTILWFMRDVLMNGPQTPGILARRIAPPALMMALGPVLTTKPDQHDNRVKDRQTDKDFRCCHRALTGQRGPTDQDLSGLLYVAPAYGYVFICIPGSPLQVAKPRSLIE